MPGDDDRKKRKKKKGRRNRSTDAIDEEAPLAVDQGEAEFANTAVINADNEPILVANADGEVAAASDDGNDEEGQPILTLVQEGDDEDAIPAPIAEPEVAMATGEPEFTEDGLAVAMAVDTAAEDEYIYSAIEFDPDSKPPLHKNRRFRVYTCLAFVVVIAVVSVVVIMVTKNAKGPEIVDVEQLWDGDPSTSPTGAPTTDREAAGIKEQIEAGVLQRGENFTNMDRNDPRYKALDWILHADQLQLDSDDKNLYQRYVLALMAFTLDSLAWYFCGEHRKFGNVTEEFVVEDCEVQNMATGQMEAHNVWLSSTEECDWYGVICSQDEVVRGVELIGNDLIGEIPAEISQLRFLQYLALNGNCLYGTVPAELGSMPSLLSLELHGNGLSGELPPELTGASKLQLLNVAMQYQYSYQCTRSDGQQISTLLRMGGLTNPVEYNYGLYGTVLETGVEKWGSMKGLHLFDNDFYGTIAEEIGQLKYLVFLRAHNNLLSGYIPYGIGNLKKTREVYLHKNMVLLDLPQEIGDMEDLEDLRVNENPMAGRIPETIYNLKKLKKLWLQDTMDCQWVNMTDPTSGEVYEKQDCDMSSEVGFYGSISTEIGNLKKLQQLLINNNPLTGVIPTEIGQCEELALLHMHQTKIEGSSPRELCMLRDKNFNIKENQVGIFYADCSTNNGTQDPFFACDCCTDCCDHTTQVCVADD